MSLTAKGSILSASNGVNVTGGVVTLVSLQGGIGASTTSPLLLDVGDANNDQLTIITTGGGVYIEQPTGDLRLYSINTTDAVTNAEGDVWIDVVQGSLIDANTGVQQDARPQAQQNPASTTFDLTDLGDAQLAALKAYQLSQEQEYQTYWSDLNALTQTALLSTSSSSASAALPPGSSCRLQHRIRRRLRRYWRSQCQGDNERPSDRSRYFPNSHGRRRFLSGGDRGERQAIRVNVERAGCAAVGKHR